MLYYTNMASKEEIAFRKELSKKLTNAREKLGLTQEQVAKKAGIGINHYAKLERGEHTPKGLTLQKVYDALKIS